MSDGTLASTGKITNARTSMAIKSGENRSVRSAARRLNAVVSQRHSVQATSHVKLGHRASRQNLNLASQANFGNPSLMSNHMIKVNAWTRSQAGRPNTYQS